jgi:hypothetical protein
MVETNVLHYIPVIDSSYASVGYAYVEDEQAMDYALDEYPDIFHTTQHIYMFRLKQTIQQGYLLQQDPL